MQFEKIKILGIGEVLWDVFKGKETFGGAPANFAIHCSSFGVNSKIISNVGDDDLGKRALQFLEKHRVESLGCIINKSAPTGVVNIHLDKAGIPEFEISENVAWDNMLFDTSIRNQVKNMDAVCFGTLGQRTIASKKTIHSYLQETKSDCLRVFDLNLRQNYYSEEIIEQSLELANVLKINDEELIVLQSMFKLEGDTLGQMRQLMDKFQLRLGILTCGASGAYIFSDDDMSFEKPQDLVKVVSTVGAGDAFTARAVIGFLNNEPLSEINKNANKMAAYVCTQQSAVPELPKYLKYEHNAE